MGLKVDNSQCKSHCFSTNQAAQFISQSLHEGQFKPVAPIKSVTGMRYAALSITYLSFVSQKDTKLLSISSLIFTDIPNVFTDGFSRELATKSVSKYICIAHDVNEKSAASYHYLRVLLHYCVKYQFSKIALSNVQ